MKPELHPQASKSPAKLQIFKWEKRHSLLLIGLACLTLWYLAPSLKSMPLLQSALNLLPTIGGLAFATETILKLAH